MGALDDAIREHLELKRRHGASDEEIKQAEAEALGPARRTPGSGLSAVPGETALDEAGMPAPVEAFEPPPEPGSAVHNAPPPPPEDPLADPAAVPPPRGCPPGGRRGCGGGGCAPGSLRGLSSLSSRIRCSPRPRRTG